MTSAWQADHLRLSLFCDKPWTAAPEAMFQAIFHGQPDSVVQKPVIGEATAEGPWLTQRASIKRLINRIDILVSPFPSTPLDFPLLSSLSTLLPSFSSSVASWYSTQDQDVTRIAIGCGGLLEVANRVENYKKLHDLIRVINVDVDRFRDFNFQVNLPSTSNSEPNLTINRLTNWAAIEAQLGLIDPSGNKSATQTRHFCRCTADINTDGERVTPIAKAKIGSLIDEMTAITLQVLEKGIE